jgi:hypothetical protein
MALTLEEMSRTPLTLEEMSRTALTHEEMKEITQAEERREENLRKVVAMFDAMLADDLLSDDDYSNLLEQVEALHPTDIAVMAEDLNTIHEWIEGVLTFLNHVPCRYGTLCTRWDCADDHPEGREIDNHCRYGTRCTQRDCADDHPKGRLIDNPCQFRIGCTRPDCSYVHPEGREIDNDVVAAPTQACPVVCERGYYCRYRECANSHPKSREIDRKCKAGKGCTRHDCMFDHN